VAIAQAAAGDDEAVERALLEAQGGAEEAGQASRR
jgi:hypothetical protein